MDASKYDLIRRAVRERLQVSADYDGRRREFCPHAVGTTGGEPRCFAFQFGGESGAGPVTVATGVWRCFRVDRLGELDVRPGAWHTGPAPTRPQTCVREVDLEVQAPPRATN